MGRRYRIRYVSPAGEQWLLSDAEWTAGLKHGGITGLIGTREPLLQQGVVGVEGDYVAGHRVPGMTGELTVLVRGGRGTSAQDEWASLRRAFNTDESRPGYLFIEPAGGVGESLQARVRLNGYVSEPEADDAHAEVVNNVRIPLAADEGVWLTRARHATGEVLVTNDGDTPLPVAVEWSGAGGAVTVPSGASFTLPAAPETRVLHLESRLGCLVTDESGRVDRDLWVQVRKTALPELVPVGAKRSFTVPEGAVLRWQVRRLDPWG